MNEQQTVADCINELNSKKDNIVKTARDFVNYGADISKRTDKKQERSKDIIRVSERSAQAIMDIKGTIPKFTVPIYAAPTIVFDPNNKKQFIYGVDSINLKVLVNNVYAKPYHYIVIGKKEFSNTDFPIAGGPHDGPLIELKDIKERGTALQVGKYDIIVDIRDPKTGKQIVTNKTTIEIIPGNGPVNQSLMIVSPGPADPAIPEYDHITLLLDTTNLEKPYAYNVVAVPEPAGSGPNIPLMSQPKQVPKPTSGPDIHSESYTITTHLDQGKYKLIVIYQNGLMPNPEEKAVIINIGPPNGPTPIGTHTVKLISPTNASSPIKTTSIPIKFEVTGPHHDAGKDYVYILTILDKNGKRVALANNRGTAKGKTVTHGEALNVGDGQYNIQVTTADPITKKILATTKETFVVNIGGGPTPGPTSDIIKSIVINNTFYIDSNNNSITYNNVTLPHLMPIQIMFRLIKPEDITYFSTPQYISISITERGSGKLVYEKRDDSFIGTGYILTENDRTFSIPFKNAGLYDMLITIRQPNGKVTYNNVITIEITEVKTPKPVVKKGNAIFSVIVGGKDVKSGNTYTTVIKSGKKSVIKVKNSGTGGNIVWQAMHDPWIKVTPGGSAKPIKKDNVEEIIIELDSAALSKIKTTGTDYGRVVIAGAYGTKVTREDWKTPAAICKINFKLK